MKRLLATAALSLALITSAHAGKGQSNAEKNEAIENMGTVVAAMRKCDNLTLSPVGMKALSAMAKMYGVDVNKVNEPTITFMASQLAFETEYKENPEMTCKLAKLRFDKVLEYSK